MKLHRLKYQTKLAGIYSIIMFLIITIFSTWAYIREADDISKGYIQSMNINVDQASKNIDNAIKSLYTLTSTLMTNSSVYKNLSDASLFDISSYYESGWKRDFFDAILISQLSTMEHISSVAVYSTNGGSFYRSKTMSEVQMENLDYKTQAWFKKINMPDVQKYEYIHYDNDVQNKIVPMLTVVRKIYDLDTLKVVGYIRVDYNLGQLEKETLKKLLISKDGYYQLIDNDGTILLSNIEGTEKLNFDFDLMNGSIGGMKINKNNNTYIMSYSRLETNGWTLVYYFPYKEIEDKLRNQYMFQGIIFLVSIAAAIIISFFTSTGMTKNIKRLNKAMLQAETNPKIRIKVKSQDEIGMLSNSFNKMLDGLNEMYDRLYKSEIDAKEAQIMALQAQINPHFFYNTMETIDALCINEETELASEIVRAMSSSFRYAMKNDQYVPLKAEINHVSDYITIMKIRYPDKIDYSLDIDPGLINMKIPRLTLQPIIENAILHGLLPKLGDGLIKIIIKKSQNDEVKIEVSDNGVGMDEACVNRLMQFVDNISSNENNDECLALKNVNKRLKYFYGNQYGITIKSAENEGSDIIITIPCDKELKVLTETNI